MEHGIVNVVSDIIEEDAHQEHRYKFSNLVDAAVLHNFVFHEGVLPVEFDLDVC